MNKTISINLGGRNFFIEEVAFEKLDAYLSGIKRHFAAYRGSGEIVADMESRIGEKFGEKYQNDSQAVVTVQDVENLIGELGTVEDIASEEGAGRKSESVSAGQSFAPKRLMRNGDDKIIAGVCSGLAAYFDTDPFIFRLVFGLLIFAWGSIIPIYFLLWLIMPEAITPTEKMQMRGEPMNLDTISASLKERAEEFKQHVNEVKDKKEWKQWGGNVKERAQAMGREMGEAGKQGSRGLGGFLRTVFQGLGKIIVFLFVVLRRVVGIALVVAFGLAIAGVTFGFAVAVSGGHSAYVGLPFTVITHSAAYYALLAAAYIIILIPLQFLLLLAAALFGGRRGGLRASVGYSLFSIWLVALIVGGVLGGQYIPGYVEQVKNSPEFQTISRTYDVKDFNKLHLSDSGNYKLVQGDHFEVKAEGWAGDLDRLNLAVEGDTLNIGSRPHVCVFCISKSPRVEITAPDFEDITATDSSSVESSGITATSSSLTLSNSSFADIQYKVQDLSASLSNSSLANLSGSANVLNAKLRNSSRLNALDLLATDANINAVNSSSANLNVVGTLKSNSSNSSRINYIGNPQILNSAGRDPFALPPVSEEP